MMTPPSKLTSLEQTQHLEAYLARLEEEKLKIDSFKRDLPICMELLTNAMERSRQELQSHMTNESVMSPIQFIPLKNDTERAEWMASARIWNHDIKENDGTLLDLNAKQRRTSYDDDDEDNSLETVPRRSSDNNNSGESCGKNTTRRKARRCWSPDLHKRFVNALHMLGGSQATPKQIRELMKVDGLTNDEVKSHLQTSYEDWYERTSRRHRAPFGDPRMGPTRIRSPGKGGTDGHLVWEWEHMQPPLLKSHC